jgi:hypothetical protein
MSTQNTYLKNRQRGGNTSALHNTLLQNTFAILNTFCNDKVNTSFALREY